MPIICVYMCCVGRANELTCNGFSNIHIMYSKQRSYHNYWHRIIWNHVYFIYNVIYFNSYLNSSEKRKTENQFKAQRILHT